MTEETVQEQKKGFNWLLGCGLGCGALFIIAVLGVVAVALLARKGYKVAMEQMSNELAVELQAHYDDLKEKDKVPEQHKALFDELVGLGNHENSTPWTKIICLSVMMFSLEDGELTEKELELTEETRDRLEAKPAIGLFDVMEFFEAHPELQEYADEYQGRYEIEPPQTDATQLD